VRLYSLWAKVEYDGTDYYGFQIQASERTVQGEIERALEAVAGKRIKVIGAGRTDRGVHARGQVVGFEVEWRHSLEDLHRALNAVLSADVAISEMGPAPEGFHPRFSALSRTYRYTLLNQKLRSPLARRRAWHVAQALEPAAMEEASYLLVGQHDFSTFGLPPQGENTVRTVLRANWQEQKPFLTFDIEANAFLYRMVRCIVGTLVQVGCGMVSLDGFAAILQARDRSQGKNLAPAHGLCLMCVDYPEGVLQ
jgi:tRNA pseudouridine38-40 synthase